MMQGASRMPNTACTSIVEEIEELAMTRRLRFHPAIEVNVTHADGEWVCRAPVIGDLVTGSGPTVDAAKKEFALDAFNAWDAGQFADLSITEH